MLAVSVPETKLWGVEQSVLSGPLLGASCASEVRSTSVKDAELEICAVVLRDCWVEYKRVVASEEAGSEGAVVEGAVVGLSGEFTGGGSSGNAIGGSGSFRPCCTRVVEVVVGGIVAAGGSSVPEDGD